MISMLMDRMQCTEKLQSLVCVILIAGLASTLTIPNGTGVWPVIFSLAGLTMLFGRLKNVNHDLPLELQCSFRNLAITAAVAIVVPLSIDILHANPISPDPYITLILLPFIAVVIFRFQIPSRVFFLGVLFAAITAAFLAIYEHFYQGIGRAQGFMNPIPFGDVCVVFAITLLIRANSTFRQNKFIAATYLLGACCGAYASLLSGSKGGWLALTLGSAILIWRFLISVGFGRVRRLSIMALLAVSVVLLTPNSVKSRLESGASGAVQWIKTGDITEGSVSARFELWTWGILGFSNSPLIGLSQEELRELRIEASKDGRLDPRINQYPDTQDNEYIDQLANRGILGFAAMILTLVVPFLVFRKFRSPKDQQIDDLALTGQMLPLMFAEFGLSVSLWGTSTFRLLYVSWIVLLLALIAVRISSNRRAELVI